MTPPLAADLLTTKATTLAALAPNLTRARVLPLHIITVGLWRKARQACLDCVPPDLLGSTLIVRSSARSEDQVGTSMAGKFLSVPNVVGLPALVEAIDQVITSYGSSVIDEDEVLLQPMLRSVSISGVAFSADPNTGTPYRVINYSHGSDTTQVTGGHGDLATLVVTAGKNQAAPAQFVPVLELLDELQAKLPWPHLDIEFAIDDGKLHLLQVRPLSVAPSQVTPEDQQRLLKAVAERIAEAQRPHPFLHGKSTVFGVMPDWNPAEIIGIRPRPLALSLYKELVTDSTWAYQRHNYGYHNLRSHPLMLHFHGQPYIDVRASFNSFIPRDIDAPVANRLVDYYTEALIETPSLHDKIEFEIVFSCYTLDLPQRLGRLAEHGFSAPEQQRLADSLRALTNRIIDRNNGLWRTDEARLQTLVARHREVMAADFGPIERIYWLIEDCKRYGTLPFAGLARAGFIAVQMLKSLVTVGVFSDNDYAAFMGGLNTVSKQLGRDFVQMDRTTFLSKYGHLRPGTYDILSPRYDEAPEIYFSAATPPKKTPDNSGQLPFALTLAQLREIGRLLGEHGLSQDVVGLFEFLQAGIELREYAKFLFTRNLSDALSLLRQLGESQGFTADDMSYADIRVIHSLQSSCADPKAFLKRSINEGRARYAETCAIWLPPLITSPQDVWSFALPSTEPNFITQKMVSAPVSKPTPNASLDGTIVCIPSADPGFDWLFSHPIAGLVTAYGGANSHMAIRANELGLPAVIGAGESLFGRWSAAHLLHIDCAARKVDVLA
jgi:phosphohistidine swiveling domain-containing protein